MKVVVYIFISLLLIVMVGNGVKAQKKPPETVRKNTVEVAAPGDPKRYEDWQRVEARGLSFYVPKDFKVTRNAGADGTGWIYKSPALRFILIAGNVVDGPLIAQTKLPGYREKRVNLDGIAARMWFYEDRSQEYPYVGVSTFKDPLRKDFRYTMFLESKNADGQELGEKIFRSIKFDKK